MAEKSSTKIDPERKNFEQCVKSFRSPAKLVQILALILLLADIGAGQDLTRDIAVTRGSDLVIVNKYGRVSVQADTSDGAGKLTISSQPLASDSDIKIDGSSGRLEIKVGPKNTRKRIDLTLTLPERTDLSIETKAGAVEIAGSFSSVKVKTETGTISTNVPIGDLRYKFEWTESRPRYLADFDISEVKEKSAGRFEIKGSKSAEDKRKKGRDTKISESAVQETPEASQSVSLDFTTARGIILLNVPPNEVMSDLRERPLTNAAKAIIRSGDSLLMEAIRHASPKYFGDYSRSLPPFSREPTFSRGSAQLEVPVAAVKTALVRVTDLQNRSVDGLTAADFDVVEGGTEREIVSVERSTAPFNLVLLLDVSGSVENYVNFIRKVARSFVETVDGKDLVSIITFNDDVKVLSPFTTDKEKLSKSLDTFDAGGATAYYDALAFTVADTLRPLRGGRTAIVILTDGDDNRSFLAFDSLLGSIQESGALIYPLYVPSELIALSANGKAIDPIRQKYLSLTAKSSGEGERLAKISGGEYYPIRALSQIQTAYEDIVRQLRAVYSVTYRSNVADGERNPARLKIRTKRENTFTTVTSVMAGKSAN